MIQLLRFWSGQKLSLEIDGSIIMFRYGHPCVPSDQSFYMVIDLFTHLWHRLDSQLNLHDEESLSLSNFLCIVEI